MDRKEPKLPAVRSIVWLDTYGVSQIERRLHMLDELVDLVKSFRRVEDENLDLVVSPSAYSAYER
jgi:hypothetical protein